MSYTHIPDCSRSPWSPTDEATSAVLATRQVAGIVHDLGNLIQIASSAMNIVARDPSVNTSGLEAVIAGAQASLKQAGALVRQTIGMAGGRIAAGDVDVAASLTEIAALVRIGWGHVIRLDMKIEPDLPHLNCDALALQNAVLNVLFNARDAMPDGGLIAVRAKAISWDSGSAVELRVADNGLGMTPDTVVRAFEPFFTTKCDGLGGVGLSMVERFVHDAGGRIFIESEYGVGTTVTLQLPASGPPGQTLAELARSAGAAAPDPNRAISPDAQASPEGSNP